MRYCKKILKFVLPSLSVTPIIAIAGVISSCANIQKDLGPEATKVNVFLEDLETGTKIPLNDQMEFDIKKVKKLKLTATVEPAEAHQDVIFKIIEQEGTGNIACSQAGIIYPNSCVGTIKIKAISNTKNKKESDVFELVFYDNDRLNWQFIKELDPEGKEITNAYATINADYFDTIEEVSIPSFYTDSNGVKYNVAGVGYSGFNGCNKLWYVHLPKKSPYFKYICAYSFYQCNNIEKIYIPDSVVYIDVAAFHNCSSLSNVYLGSNIKYILAEAFRNCGSIVSLDLPQSLVSIGPSAFSGCGLINQLNIPKTVSIIGESAFANCWNCHVTIDPENEYFIADNKGIYSKDSKTKGIGNRLISCQYSFKPGRDSKYIIPDQIKRIDGSAFEYCDKLKFIEFTDNSECESIGEDCFALCSGLAGIKLPKKLSQIKKEVFSYCWNLSSITIPENVQIISRDAFYGCDSLNSVHFECDEINKDQRNEWIIGSTAVEPEYSECYNTNYEPDKERTQDIKDYENAIALTLYGNWENPQDPTKKWEGGYGNCTWVKNSSSIDLSDSRDFTYIGSNYINKGFTSFRFKIRFGSEIKEEDNRCIKLKSDYGEDVSNEELKFFGKENEEKEFTFTLKPQPLKASNRTKIWIK